MADDTDSTPLGRSFRIEDGDLVFDDNKDLTTVRGLNNFLQGAGMIADTPFATDVFNSNYGLDILGSLGQPHGIRVVKEVLRLNLVKSFSADSRVREVKDVVFDDDPRFGALLNSSGAVQHQKRSAVSAAVLREEHKSRRWKALVVLTLIPEGEVTFQVEGERL